MAKYSERNTEVRSHGFEDSKALAAELEQLKLLDWEEAMWRLRHEENVMLDWVRKRFSFMRSELREVRATMPKHKPALVSRVTGEPGIQSHQHGRGIARQRYGEKFG